MMLVSFILIPNPICSLWVAFSIVSIEVGVIGYMAWWNVSLDGIALINLIMCVGFSVDFSAHICYHYMSEDGKSPEDRISASLYALGIPILQGGTSTILGVIGLAFAPSYLYVTFFKMIFLVIFLGIIHGLILLPVLLSLFGPGSCDSRGSARSSISTPSTTVSIHSTHPSCYTINLGFATPDHSRRKEGAVPFKLPVDHFQRRHVGVTMQHSPLSRRHSPLQHSPDFSLQHSPDFRQFRQSEFDPDRFTFVTRIADEHLVSGPGVRVPINDPRLTPVPESDEHLENLPPLNKNHLQHKTQAQTGQYIHKKVCRSKSHRPRTQSTSDKQLPKERSSKPPLRKYHSFPYHMFMNEGGYSSDESIKSAFEEKRSA